MNLPTLAFNSIVTFFLLGMMVLGNCQLSISLVVFCLLVCATLTKAGELLLEKFQIIQLKAKLPTSFIVGFIVISLPMVVLTFTLHLSALAAFALTALSVLSLSFYNNRLSKTLSITSRDWTDITPSLIIALTIALLARNPVSSPTVLIESGMIPIWSDYFLHGITISSFGSPFSNGLNMELAGTSQIFYHYAPFMIPATFQSLSGMSGFALSTSLLLPLGLLIAAFGVYVLAEELGGRFAGFITLAIIICIPAYSTFIQSGWFDFYWLLFIAPGSGFAIGVSALVCATTILYLNKRDVRVFWFSLLLLCTLPIIRVQMFMLLAPTIVAVILFQFWREKTKLIFGIMISSLITGFLLLHFSESLHQLWIKYSKPHDYLNIATSMSSFYGQAVIIPNYLLDLSMLIQIIVILISILGIYFVLYPLMFWLSLRQRRLKESDTIPLFLTLTFIILMVFAPVAGNNDLTEYKHRHFLLVYVLIAIYSITYGIQLIINSKFRLNLVRFYAGSLAIAMICLTIFLNWNSNPAQPNVKSIPWTEGYHNQRITPGLLEVAQYLRENAKYGDVLAMDKSAFESDPRAEIIEIISLTGVSGFLARADLRLRGSECIKAVVTKRLDLLKDLSTMDNWLEAKSFLQTNGIRWYISPKGENPKWSQNQEESIFSSKGMAVYDAGFPTSDILKKPKC
jgi:hypothetical protein